MSDWSFFSQFLRVAAHLLGYQIWGSDPQSIIMPHFYFVPIKLMSVSQMEMSTLVIARFMEN